MNFEMNIVPVSDLREYNKALEVVDIGSPVILTKNGRAKYTVVDFEEFKKMSAVFELFEELNKGIISLETEETYGIEDVAKWCGVTHEV